MGPHCSFCGTSTGPFSEIEGLFTMRICIPCLEVRQAQPDRLLGFHDPGQPWEQWGCPIGGCGRWFLGPWDLEGHTAAEHPGWTATYELLRALPEPAPASRLPPRRAAGELTLSVGGWCLLAEPPRQLLLLDKPTNNLDLASTRQLAQALAAYRGAPPGGRPRPALSSDHRDHPLAAPGGPPDPDRPAVTVIAAR